MESTARSAYDLGYNVVLVADAMTGLDADAHSHSVEKIFLIWAEWTQLKMCSRWFAKPQEAVQSEASQSGRFSLRRSLHNQFVVAGERDGMLHLLQIVLHHIEAVNTGLEILG
jgi:hypothetical protein